MSPPLLSAVADAARTHWTSRLDPGRRCELGQYFTPSVVGRFMASWFSPRRRVRLLDPGAGVGSLTAAFVEAALGWERPPTVIEADAVEADRELLGGLRSTLDACRAACDAAGVSFTFRVVEHDFLETAVSALEANLLPHTRLGPFDAVIMNPPYRKVRTDSRERAMLRRVGIETSNLYTAFLALAARLVVPGGEMVAITPRSFCNGPYFRPFRESFFAEMVLDRAHVFERRDRAFNDDDVLQENVVFRAVRGRDDPAYVVVSSSDGPSGAPPTERKLRVEEVLDRRDSELIVRLPTGRSHRRVASTVGALPCSLEDLGLSVSTGRVIDFRARPFLRAEPGPDTVPLVYPEAFSGGRVAWPKHPSRKPQAIALRAETEKLLVPAGHYVLVKRFSAKEEPRRIVAAVYDPGVAPGVPVGFENHLNYLHRRGAGLPPVLADGLAAYLNSAVVDAYFRQESGHTQVNAADLRRLRFPTVAQLVALAASAAARGTDAAKIDEALSTVLRAAR
jgi:adenine-specific DNA-methyltransferase